MAKKASKKSRSNRAKSKAKARYVKRRRASKHGKHQGKDTQFPA